MNRLLVFSNDAAGANMTMAFIFFYKKNYDEVKIFPNGPAYKLYNKKYPSLISNIDNLKYEVTDTIITGTSGLNSNYEMSVIKKASLSNIFKSIVLVDNVANFLSRFKLNNKIIEEKYINSEIWIDHTNFKSNIQYLDNKMVYKKDFYKSYIKAYLEKNPPKKSHPFIKKNTNKYLVILTEYLFELYGLKFGFTEYEMLEYILISINKSNKNIAIFLKLHPSEHKNKFNIILRKYSHLNIIKDDCNIQDLIYYSNVVFGINSSLFMESDLFNKPTYSIQLNSNKTMLVERLDNLNIIYTHNKLNNILNKHFLN